MTDLYPLKFTPIFKEKIWGGQKLKTLLNKDFGALANCGESWEVSGVKGNESVVAEGPLKGKKLPDLLEVYKEQLVGKKIYTNYQNQFPLLIKFIDANEDLSIQVHPDDALAKRRHDSLGKTEMWYVFQADEGAKLITGFNQSIDKKTYLSHLKEGTLREILNEETVSAGDVYFIPAGRVHTIGKGMCIAEIQQTSDVTYRIYDFDRVDTEGKKRELHTELALDALDFHHYPEYKTRYSEQKNLPVHLVQCPYFSVNKLNLDCPLTRDYSSLDSFIIYICYQGKFSLKWENGEIPVNLGESILLPASIKKTALHPAPDAGILEVAVDPCKETLEKPKIL